MTDSDSPTQRPYVQIALSWCWFFLLLLSYYCLKPLRDGLASEMAGRLGDLYLVTFISTIISVSLYSKLVAVVSRRTFVAAVYQFFAVCLVGFGLLFSSSHRESLLVVSAFFVWVSVFNLFVVTVFWSVMADLFHPEQGKMWFGMIAAAGSVGSVCGSAIALRLSQWTNTTGLIVASLVALELASLISIILLSLRRPQTGETAPADSSSPLQPADDLQRNRPAEESGTGGTVWAGFTHVLQSPYLLAICLFVSAGKFAATFVYNNLQVSLLDQMPAASERTALFSRINLYSQSGSLLVQALIVGWIMKRLGVGAALLVPATLTFVLFVWLWHDPSLRTLIAGQVGQQILAYGLLVPAQHVLFTVVSREDKYKSKAFTETVVFRGSDVAAGKACDWMVSTGTPLAFLAAAMLPLITAWMAIAGWLGLAYRSQAELHATNESAKPATTLP
ncbi:MAG: hypothetical protein U0795_06135 [Pirellulales bacterium]